MADTTVRQLRPQLTEAALQSDDVELWLFRVPKEFDPSDLVMKKMKVKDSTKAGTVLRIIESDEAEGSKDNRGNKRSYDLVSSDASEAQTARVLVQSRGSAEALHCGKPFSRFFEVRQSVPPPPSAPTDGGEVDEQEAEDKAVVIPAVPVQHLVVPYAPLAQVKGLGIVFKPPGAGSDMPVLKERGPGKKRPPGDSSAKTEASETKPKSKKKRITK